MRQISLAVLSSCEATLPLAIIPVESVVAVGDSLAKALNFPQCAVTCPHVALAIGEPFETSL